MMFRRYALMRAGSPEDRQGWARIRRQSRVALVVGTVLALGLLALAVRELGL